MNPRAMLNSSLLTMATTAVLLAVLLALSRVSAQCGLQGGGASLCPGAQCCSGRGECGSSAYHCGKVVAREFDRFATYFEVMSRSILVPPLNFAPVASGVYRSGYPNKKNFSFLRTLALKSVMYLCPEDYHEDNLEFLQAHGITLFHYLIKGNKEPFQEIDGADVQSALERILDPANRPILIHCNKGKHRIGCIVGCLRKLQNWSMTSIFDEYRRFAGEKIRIADQEFIELFESNTVRYLYSASTVHAFPGIQRPLLRAPPQVDLLPGEGLADVEVPTDDAHTWGPDH